MHLQCRLLFGGWLVLWFDCCILELSLHHIIMVLGHSFFVKLIMFCFSLLCELIHYVLHFLIIAVLVRVMHLAAFNPLLLVDLGNSLGMSWLQLERCHRFSLVLFDWAEINHCVVLLGLRNNTLRWRISFLSSKTGIATLLKALLVVLVGSLHQPVSRYDTEYSIKQVRTDHPTFLFGMIVMAFTLLACCCWAFLGAVVQWVILKLLPSVAHIAGKLIFTTIDCIVVDEPLGLPVGASIH